MFRQCWPNARLDAVMDFHEMCSTERTALGIAVYLMPLVQDLVAARILVVKKNQ